jgi:diguanylate cyclase (GGDEF)-like protein
MTDMLPARRVAVLAQGEPGHRLRELSQTLPLRCWDFFLAETCEHAHFLVQVEACDVLVVDHSALGTADGLGWLTAHPEVPVLFLSDSDPGPILDAIVRGVHLWLTRPMALAQPTLLAAALQHAILGRDNFQKVRRGDNDLGACRRQVTRLANLLWDTMPVEGRTRWFNQRYMLERFHEEVCRTERHGAPLSIVLGEVWVDREGSETVDQEVVGPAPSERVSQWTAGRIAQSKRRCDVAGQYGLRGFMVLLPHTPPEGAARFCRRLQTILEDVPAADPIKSPLLSCFGIAGCSGSVSSQRLLCQAEERLDEARAVRLQAREPLTPGVSSGLPGHSA